MPTNLRPFCGAANGLVVGKRVVDRKAGTDDELMNLFLRGKVVNF